MDELVFALKRFQADSVVFYSTAHGFHWNVEGPMFKEYHAFFGEIYSDVYGSIDTIAEWIRKFGSYAPYTLSDFIAAQTYGDVQLDSNSPITMARQLLAMNVRMISTIESMFRMPGIETQQGLLNFLAERQDKHQFWSWQLKSSITPTVN